MTLLHTAAGPSVQTLQMTGLVMALVSAWLVIVAIRWVFRILAWVMAWVRYLTFL